MTASLRRHAQRVLHYAQVIPDDDPDMQNVRFEAAAIKLAKLVLSVYAREPKPDDVHRAEVALRTAAFEFVRGEPSTDAADRAGQQRNQRLLRAARRYADVVSRAK
jgi:hypothetical protein